MDSRAGAPRDDEIFFLTARGNAELSGAGTSLSPAELEILVLVDGRSNVAQVLRGAHGLAPEAAREALRKLRHAQCIESAAKVHSDGIDAGGLFTTDAAHAAVGSLQSSGYYVRIARRPHHDEHHDRASQAAESKPAVLVVDDDPALGKMLRTYLTLEGYAPRIAANRAQIVDALRHPPKPDLVLLDVTLPDADGFEVLASIRRHPALKTVPVIMLSAKSTREAVLKGLEGGADGYLTKPFEIEVLMKAVRSVLGRDASGHAERDAAAEQTRRIRRGRRLSQAAARAARPPRAPAPRPRVRHRAGVVPVGAAARAAHDLRVGRHVRSARGVARGARGGGLSRTALPPRLDAGQRSVGAAERPARGGQARGAGLARLRPCAAGCRRAGSARCIAAIGLERDVVRGLDPALLGDRLGGHARIAPLGFGRKRGSQQRVAVALRLRGGEGDVAVAEIVVHRAQYPRRGRARGVAQRRPGIRHDVTIKPES